MPLHVEDLHESVRALARMTLEHAQADYMETARAILRALDSDALRQKIDMVKERIPWLVARPLGEPPGAVFPAPAAPRDHTVMATDGSHIAPDRHSPVRYLVLNVGRVRIRYGTHPRAEMESKGKFLFREDEITLTVDNGRQYPLEGTLLALEMALAELEALVELARDVEPPAVALRDGSLIFWPLQSEEPAVQAHYLPRIRRVLRAFHDLGIPLVSYISYPGSRDVVNAVRVWLCGHCTRANECGACRECRPEDAALCAWLRPVRDQWLLAGILRPGERSAIFESTSAVLEHYSGDEPVNQHVRFFYVHTGEEIARVEAPAWVMDAPEYRELVHALIVDQCQRGGGYPPVLQEAHEQAVISAAEREMVNMLVEQELARLGVAYIRSRKEWSKRVRGI